MSGNYYFVIVGHHDNPIYEQEHCSRDGQSKKDDYRDLCQFVAHASLDMIGEHMWTTNSMYLKVSSKKPPSTYRKITLPFLRLLINLTIGTFLRL